jgi:nicotinate phosphoribosyltransferase
MGIIKSLLDTDLYKLTMQQAVYHQIGTNLITTYKVIFRDDILFELECIEEIKEEIKFLCELRFTQDELDYLSNIRFFSKYYIEFLSYFKLNFNYVYIEKDNINFKLEIEGPWYQTILFETPVLAIINEVYNKYTYPENVREIGFVNLKNKLLFLQQNDLEHNLKIADFGTRRRYSFEWQDIVIRNLLSLNGFKEKNLIGTSNVYYANKYNITSIGTMAHEFIGSGSLSDCQSRAFDCWIKEYSGDLGIVLSDTLGMDVFIRKFGMYYAKLFDGVRQDSGDPITIGEKLVKMYINLGIDPTTKTIVFSDSLNFEKVISIYRYFKGVIKMSFGIGTWLTNDMGFKPLNVVMKMVKFMGDPVVKLSDDPGKEVCIDTKYLKQVKDKLKWI